MSRSPHFSNLSPGGPKTINYKIYKMLFPEETATRSIVVIYNIAILVVMFNSHNFHSIHGTGIFTHI